jgi:hypothetical protein
MAKRPDRRAADPHWSALILKSLRFRIPAADIAPCVKAFPELFRRFPAGKDDGGIAFERRAIVLC